MVPRIRRHPRRPSPADRHVGIQLPKDTEHKNTVLLTRKCQDGTELVHMNDFLVLPHWAFYDIGSVIETFDYHALSAEI